MLHQSVGGELGDKDLRVFNKALLRKCLWRFGIEVNVFSKRVIAEKYGVFKGGGGLKMFHFYMGVVYGEISKRF